MNITTFMAYARRAPFGGRLSTAQVNGLEAILAEAARRKTPNNWLAYILATAFHETGGKMAPVEENLNYTATRIKQVWPSRFATVKAAKPYERNPRKLANAVYGGRMGNAGPDDGWRYRGRGLAQITGKTNYAKFGLAADPDKALELGAAVKILFDGMEQGKFTGKKLADYLGDGQSGTTDDPIDARKIVNGNDKASLIATHYKAFLDSLTAAEGVAPKDVTPAAAQPDDKPATESRSLWTILTGMLSGGVLSAFTGGPWGVLALAMILAAVGIGVWLVASGRVEIKRIREAL